jgi:hypothetical protein
MHRINQPTLAHVLRSEDEDGDRPNTTATKRFHPVHVGGKLPASSIARLAAVLAAAVLLGAPPSSADSSVAGTFVDLEFNGRLLTDTAASSQTAIADQIRYTIGQLNGYSGGSHPAGLVTSNVTTHPVDGKIEITYHAVLPAILRRAGLLPSSLELVLPLDVSYGARQAFAAKYGDTCVDFGAHDTDAESMWYYFRPQRAGCKFVAREVHRVSARVSRSETHTTGKFPEYDRIWADKVLRAIVVFGKYEDGATTSSDAGIGAYNAFVGMMNTELAASSLVTVPATIPSHPGVAVPDIRFRSGSPGGYQIDVVALLVDSFGTPSASFRSRYASLSSRADLIVYNGHAGLGAYLRTISTAGRWARGQYAILFLNGSNTWSYLDRTFMAARRRLNADDGTGFKYLDIVANAMPPYFASMPAATMALIRGLASPDAPRTYEEILAAVNPSQFVMVLGEQDNVFRPADAGPWAGLNDSGTVTKGSAREWTTPSLPPGTYTFTLTGTGDADLYVRLGSAPTLTSYDCRPYRSGSAESCEVHLTEPRTIHVMVRGYAATSTFQIVGGKN